MGKVVLIGMPTLADTVKVRVGGFFQQLAALSRGEGARSVIVFGS